MDIKGRLMRQGWIGLIWRPVHCMVDGSTFREFSSAGGSENMHIDLTSSCRIVRVPDMRRDNCFKLIGPNNRTCIYSTDSEPDLVAWMNCLNRAIARDGNKVQLDDFRIIKVIGRGSYGKVFLVQHVDTERYYALKSMSKRRLANGDIIHNILVEREVLLGNRHPFLVSAWWSFQTDVNVFIVLDLALGGELFRILKVHGQFTEPRVQLYAAEVLLGIQHLHKLGLIHRDLKPENILIGRDGHLKITDFGFVKQNICNEGETTHSLCGTREYWAPEILKGDRYTRSVDWWSFGVIIYQMLSGVNPFKDRNEKRVAKKIICDPVDYPFSFSGRATSLLEKLLEKDPRQRLGSGPKGAEEIKAHPFFKGINWTDVLEKRLTPEWIPEVKDDTDTQNFDFDIARELAVVSPEDPSSIPQNVFENFTGKQEESVITE